MAVNESEFAVSAEDQPLLLSALNAYLYELRGRSGRKGIQKERIKQVESLHDALFLHRYGMPYDRK